jgi:hypothetical protein
MVTAATPNKTCLASVEKQWAARERGPPLCSSVHSSSSSTAAICTHGAGVPR